MHIYLYTNITYEALNFSAGLILCHSERSEEFRIFLRCRGSSTPLEARLAESLRLRILIVCVIPSAAEGPRIFLDARHLDSARGARSRASH